MQNAKPIHIICANFGSVRNKIPLENRCCNGKKTTPSTCTHTHTQSCNEKIVCVFGCKVSNIKTESGICMANGKQKIEQDEVKVR